MFFLPTLRDGDTAGSVYASILEEAVLAEALGFDTAWMAEHHFDRYGGLLPSSAVLGTAMALRTSRLRIGAAVALLPLRNALSVAEEFSMLDVLSGGRLEMGVGRGFMPREFEGMGVPMEAQGARFDEGLDVLTQAWRDGEVTLAGAHYQVQGLPVYPSPLQRPHPPIWVAASLTRSTFERAGRDGFNLMVNPYTRTDEELAAGLRWYHDARRAAGHEPATARVLANQHLYAAPTAERAREEPREALMAYVREVNDAYARSGGTRPVTSVDYGHLYPSRVCFGTPDELECRIRSLQAMGITDLCLMARFGDLPHARIHASLELFAADVMPRFRCPRS